MTTAEDLRLDVEETTTADIGARATIVAVRFCTAIGCIGFALFGLALAVAGWLMVADALVELFQ